MYVISWRRLGMKYSFILTLLCLGMGISATALAQDDAAVAACVRAAKSKTVAGAAYQPGVDVYGRKVAPADLGNRYGIQAPDVIEFDIQYDAAKRLGMNSSEYYQGNATLAKVRVEGNKLFINGQEVQTQTAADLIAACRQRVQ